MHKFNKRYQPIFAAPPQPRRDLFCWLVQFALINCILNILVSYRYYANVTYTLQTRLAPSYRAIVEIFFVCGLVGTICLLTTLLIVGINGIITIFYPRKKTVKFIAFIVALSFSLFLLTDSLVYSLYQYHINGVVLTMVLGGEAGEIFHFSSVEWMVMLSVVAGAIFVQLWAVWMANIAAAKKQRVWPSFLIFFIMLCVSWGLYCWAVIRPFREAQDSARTIPFYTDVLSAVTMQKNLARRLVQTNQPYIEQALQINLPLKYPLQALQCNSSGKRYNILFLFIDTWRFDMLNKEVTPNIARFADKSWRFTHHYSGGNATGPGLFSLFYSLPYSYWTAMRQQQVSPIFIRELLRNQYQLNVLASAELKEPAFNETAFIDVKGLRVETPGAKPYDRDRRITQDFKKFLNTRDTTKPFFSFMFYDAAHADMFPPDFPAKFNPWWKQVNHAVLSNSFDKTPYLNRYKNAVYFDDSLAGEVLKELERKKLLDSTIVVISADHGEEFNETRHNYWGHSGNFSHWQVQTPLIIYWPGEKPKTFNHFTTHFDIIPYLMQRVLGCVSPISDYSIGKPLFEEKPLPFFIVHSYINMGLIKDNTMTVVYPDGDYQIMDMNADPIPDAKLDTGLMKDSMTLMRKYFIKNSP